MKKKGDAFNNDRWFRASWKIAPISSNHQQSFVSRSPSFNLRFAWNGYLILVGKKNVRSDLSLHSSSLVTRDCSRDYSQNSLEPCALLRFPVYRDRKSDYRISVREVQRLTAFGPKSKSFTISSTEAANVVEFVCQRSDRARDQINRKFRAIWLAQYDSPSKNPPHLSLQISKIHSLSRILFQLLYILLLVRSFLIHLEREREREGDMTRLIRFSVQKSPPLFLFEFQKFTLSLSSNFYMKKERERFRWRGIQLIFQAKVIVRLFSMLRQVLVQRDSRSSRFPRESLLNPTGD